MSSSGRRPAGRDGFTLIEMMAVVLIIGLMFGLFLPNLDAARMSRLEDQAREVARRVQLARERAIMTGAPHRVWLDVEEGAMRVDWFVDEERASRAIDGGAFEPEPPPDAVLDARGRTEISLAPPQSVERDYYPVPNRFGNLDLLPVDYSIVGVDTTEGFIDVGEVQLVFGSDGSTDYAEVFVADAYENRVIVEIQPLLDRVRIRRDEEKTR